ncbi:hypothetical protein [Priestia megaterium]|uniref:hypothetical protein n=1 Tax=Priestia megaterium TaxID=1404 RepID=UPI00211C9A96|nr:hypothetical protein [Priestia megaterium]
MEDGQLKTDFYKMIGLLEGYLATLDSGDRFELENLFASISEEIEVLQREVKTYDFMISFMREWKITPIELSSLLKSVKNNNKKA